MESTHSFQAAHAWGSTAVDPLLPLANGSFQGGC